MSILISILTFVLVLVSAFLVLIVLMQKTKSDGGMGSAMGGGMAEATFGAETGNVLTKSTINAAILFFVLSFGLYLGHISQRKKADASTTMPTFAAPAAPATPTAPETPATPAVNVTTPAAPTVEQPAATTTPAPAPAK